MNRLHNHSVGRLLIAMLLTLNALAFRWGEIREVSASPNFPEVKGEFSAETDMIYDDSGTGWTYLGNWTEQTVRHVYGGKLHVSDKIGDLASISITGSRFTLVFSKASVYGKLDIYVDGKKISTINQERSKPVNQVEWISPRIGPGQHNIQLVHATGKVVNIDALRVRVPNMSSPAPTGSPAPIVPTATLPQFLTATASASLIPEVTSSPVPSATAYSTNTLLPTFTSIVVASTTNTLTPNPTSTVIPVVTNTSTSTATSTATNLPTPTLFLTSTSSSTPASGSRVFYVSVNGSDSNPGSLEQPWRSIQKAARTVIAGDTVYIRGGVYMESVYISQSGTQNQPIRFLAYPGETPVIDGNNYQLPTTYWGALLEVTGNYVQVSGMEVRYSNWMGVALTGHHDLASVMNVHHSRETGVLVSGDYGIVENSRIWQNANRNETNSPYRNGGWATGLSAARHPNYAILRGNTIFNNWGEGLSTFEANGTIMQDNIVYDNWSANVYISDSTNVTLQRNLVYLSDNSIITSGSRVGIMLGDEVYNPRSSNITIINNLVYGGYRNLYWWQGVQGGGMLNVLIANNTFVNSRSVSGIQIDYGSHQNVRFYNNIVEQEGTLPIAGIDTANGLSFSHNLWSKRPPSNAAGSGDVIADPKLAKTGSFTLPGWYQLQAASPARNTAIPMIEVLADFFARPRGALPDIGAFESDQ